MKNKSALRPVSSPGSRYWLRLTLSALPLAAVTCGNPGQLEPDANAVAVNVLGLTADATKLVVTTTLDSKPATNTSPFEVTSKLTRFGIRMAKELAGTLSIGVEAYDVDLCKVGTGTVTTPIGSPYRFEVTASMKTVSPRQCPPPPPPKTCAPNLFCWSNPLPQGNTFQALWTIAPNNVWAVGDAGLIQRYDGTTWTASASGTTESLFGVWAASANEVYAVGASGKILRYDGTKWSAENSTVTKRLAAIWGSGADAWAVGEGGIILHRNGGTWSAQTSGVATNLTGIWGRSITELYTVGDGGVIRKGDGSNWSMMTSGTTMNLSSIWGDASSAVAVGASGTILGLTGATWSAQTSGTTEQLASVFSPVAGQYMTVGTSGTVLRGTGGTWTPLPSGSGLPLATVRGTSGSDVWAGGAGGQLMRYDGNKWNSTRQGFEKQIRAMAALKPNDIWAIGDGGFVTRYDGTKWTTAPSVTTKNLNAIWAVSSTEIYVTGDGGTLLRYNGSVWDGSLSLPPAAGVDGRGIWASDPTNVWIVATSPTPNEIKVTRQNGVSLSTVTLSDSTGMGRIASPNGVWGTVAGATNVIFVVGNRFIIRVNETAGTKTVDTSSIYAPSEMRAVYGTAINDLWAVGDNGLVYRYNGAVFSAQNTGLSPAQLLGVWKASTVSDLWAVGDQGALWKFDGTSWAVRETNTRNRLNVVTGLSQMDVWVGGAAGTMLHTLPQ